MEAITEADSKERKSSCSHGCQHDETTWIHALCRYQPTQYPFRVRSAMQVVKSVTQFHLFQGRVLMFPRKSLCISCNAFPVWSHHSISGFQSRGSFLVDIGHYCLLQFNVGVSLGTGVNRRFHHNLWFYCEVKSVDIRPSTLIETTISSFIVSDYRKHGNSVTSCGKDVNSPENSAQTTSTWTSPPEKSCNAKRLPWWKYSLLSSSFPEFDNSCPQSIFSLKRNNWWSFQTQPGLHSGGIPKNSMDDMHFFSGFKIPVCRHLQWDTNSGYIHHSEFC